MKYRKWIGAALVAYGVYDLLINKHDTDTSGWALLSSPAGGFEALKNWVTPGTTYLDLALIAGGAYLLMKGA